MQNTSDFSISRDLFEWQEVRNFLDYTFTVYTESELFVLIPQQHHYFMKLWNVVNHFTHNLFRIPDKDIAPVFLEEIQNVSETRTMLFNYYHASISHKGLIEEHQIIFDKLMLVLDDLEKQEQIQWLHHEQAMRLLKEQYASEFPEILEN